MTTGFRVRPLPSPSSRYLEHYSWNKGKHFGGWGGENRKARGSAAAPGVGWEGVGVEEREKWLRAGLSPHRPPAARGLVVILFIVVVVVFVIVPAETLLHLIQEGPVIA